MPRYYLAVDDLYRDDPEGFYELTRRLADLVAGEFRVSRVRFRGLADALHEKNAEAFARVSDAVGDSEGWVEGELPGEYVDPVISLFCRGLTKAVLVADEPVFALLDDAQVYFELPANALDEVGIEGRVERLEDGYTEGVLEAVAEWDDGGEGW